MLSPPDADLVRRDPGLPGLATALDPEGLLAVLRPFLPEVDDAAATMTYVRYKPRKSCVVAYRLDVNGAVVDLYAKAHQVGGRVESRPAYDRSSGPGQRGSERIILEDGAVTVCVFPTDAKLKALRRLARTEVCARLIGKLVPERPDLRGGTIRRLRYMPERRYVAQVLTGDRAAAALKVYNQADYPMAQGNAKVFHSNAPLRVARWLGQSDHHRILMLEWLEGRLLSDAIEDPEFEAESLKLVGAALARLHAQESEALVPLTRRSETTTLRSLSANVGFLCPGLAQRLDRLTRRLASDIAQAPSMNQPIHGDFSAMQVLRSDAGVAILDLDRSARGDPATDLGLFIAHLERKALYGKLPAGRVELLRESLLEGYLEVSRRPLPLRLPLYIAVGLVRLAPDPFRHRESHWPERTAAILQRAEATLGDGARRMTRHPEKVSTVAGPA